MCGDLHRNPVCNKLSNNISKCEVGCGYPSISS